MHVMHAVWCAVMLRAVVVFQNLAVYIVLNETRIVAESTHYTPVLQYAFEFVTIVLMHQLSVGCLAAMNIQLLTD